MRLPSDRGNANHSESCDQTNLPSYSSTEEHEALLRRERNKLDRRDQIRIDIVRIFRFAATRDPHGELSIRRNVTNFFERGRLFGITQLR